MTKSVSSLWYQSGNTGQKLKQWVAVALCHAVVCITHVKMNTAGDLSRNRTVGLRIGKGEKLSAIVESMHAVAEGVLTSK